MIRLLLRLHLLMTAFCCSTIVGAQQPDSSGSSNQPATADAAPLVRYVPDQILLAIAVRPRQLLTTEALQTTLKTIDAEDLPQQISRAMTKAAGLDPLKIEQLLVLLDQPTVRLLQQQNSRHSTRQEELIDKQSIGQAMISFYDEHGYFPDEDGCGKSKGKLSWRVHLLPYLERQELYEEFRLEEPWDSDHNKTLIEKMPEVFRVTGIKEPGRTSVHIPVGEGTLFSGTEPPTLDSITDSPESTILAVVADPGTADIWTKPGGLQTDMNDPVRSFAGDSQAITVCMASGNTLTLNRSETPEYWRWLLRHTDGHWTLPLRWFPRGSQIPPGLLIRFTEDIDPQKTLTGILGSLQAAQQPVAGLTGYRINADSTAVFPDNRTLLISGADSLQLMLEPRAKPSELRQQLEKLLTTGELAAVGDVSGIRAILRQPASDDQPATPHVIQQNQFTLLLDATGSSPNLLELKVTFDDIDQADRFIQFINQTLEFLQQTPDEIEWHGALLRSGMLAATLLKFLEAPTFTRKDGVVSLTVPRPVSINTLLAKLQPDLKNLASEFCSPETPSPQSHQQAVADLAETFSTFHELNGFFPNWKQFKGSKAGLSWRVHLLQVLDPDLYIRFHMDEPWDSPHNKTLIPEMPTAFRTPAVTEPGKTSLHVFLGPDTICGADDTYSFDGVTDPSKIVLAVSAGPDTAEIWTKPAGLKYDPEDPVRCLGQIGETVLAAGYGSIIELQRNMDPAELRKAIERVPSE
ncbi:MAG: DUF1559 domain-containing protein [Planctomyces sp.]